MGKWCKKCGKIMKNPELTHCSDECLLSDVKTSKTLDSSGTGAQAWSEESEPWK